MGIFSLKKTEGRTKRNGQKCQSNGATAYF